MIYTCTLNPAIDYRMTLGEFKEGALNRASKTTLYPGGKGINVSIVLKSLGRDSRQIGFEGGFTGKYLKDYLKDTFNLDPWFTHVDGNTRINVKLGLEEGETEINAPAPNVTNDQYDAFLKTVENIDKKDVLVLAGSDIDKKFNTYERLAKLCHEKNIPFVIDSEKDNVTKVLQYEPLLLKPNLYELETIFNMKLKTEKDIVRGALHLIEEGARYVIISLGKEGAYFVSRHKVLKAPPIEGEVKNTVGAGDSMVAGFLDSYLEEESPYKAFRRAVAAASATVFSEGLADKKTIDELEASIEIEEVSL
ncbi:MAG: 1-phosphofructokinase [Bacillota bacterium]